MRRYATLKLAVALAGLGLAEPALAQVPSGCENVQKLM